MAEWRNLLTGPFHVCPECRRRCTDCVTVKRELSEPVHVEDLRVGDRYSTIIEQGPFIFKVLSIRPDTDGEHYVVADELDSPGLAGAYPERHEWRFPGDATVHRAVFPSLDQTA